MAWWHPNENVNYGLMRLQNLRLSWWYSKWQAIAHVLVDLQVHLAKGQCWWDPRLRYPRKGPTMARESKNSALCYHNNYSTILGLLGNVWDETCIVIYNHKVPYKNLFVKDGKDLSLWIPQRQSWCLRSRYANPRLIQNLHLGYHQTILCILVA